MREKEREGERERERGREREREGKGERESLFGKRESTNRQIAHKTTTTKQKLKLFGIFCRK